MSLHARHLVDRLLFARSHSTRFHAFLKVNQVGQPPVCSWLAQPCQDQRATVCCCFERYIAGVVGSRGRRVHERVVHTAWHLEGVAESSRARPMSTTVCLSAAGSCRRGKDSRLQEWLVRIGHWIGWLRGAFRRPERAGCLPQTSRQLAIKASYRY